LSDNDGRQPRRTGRSRRTNQALRARADRSRRTEGALPARRFRSRRTPGSSHEGNVVHRQRSALAGKDRWFNEDDPAFSARPEVPRSVRRNCALMSTESFGVSTN
jgi:hypothetical protein